MPELCNMQLIESLGMALETMAFMTLSPAAPPVRPPDNPVLIRVQFRGAGSGSIEIVTSIDLGLMLVDSTLGCDSSETLILPNPRDPLVELANITCGLLLKSRPGAQGAEMSVPQVQEFDAPRSWDEFISHVGCDLVCIEDYVVAIRLIEG